MYTSNASQTAHNYDVILNGAGSDKVEKKLLFSSISAVRKKNKESGYNFFDRKTMKFWDSKIESTLYKGCLFITSEKKGPSDETRHFAIRQAFANGNIITHVPRYSTLESARDAIRGILVR